MILIKTETGNQVFRDRSVRLTPRQRSAFILFDGQRSVDDVLASGVGIEPDDVSQLVAMGLLATHPASVRMDWHSEMSISTDARSLPGVRSDVAHELGGSANEFGGIETLEREAHDAGGRSPQQRYMDAYPIATRLTASLGLRGFRLNLSVEASAGYQDLVALAPKIRAAVGAVKAEPLDRALGVIG